MKKIVRLQIDVNRNVSVLQIKMKKEPKSIIKVVVHWCHFGPYHIARLESAFNNLKQDGILLIGMEVTSQSEFYAWDKVTGPTVFERHVVFPDEILEHVSPLRMWRGVMSSLDRINPDAVAISGYSYYDAWAALIWCKLHRRPAILMTDSKRDDFHRVAWKEWLKRGIVQQFNSGFYAGERSREYLLQLGMNPEKIFDGIDVVDTDFFRSGAENARNNPEKYNTMLGLENPDPYFLASSRFVPRKNLIGLLRAYKEYYTRVQRENSYQPWRLVILGDGVERRNLEKFVISENLNGVSFPGFKQIEDLPIYYGLASAFIHAAMQDQWGLVVNEAMAAGLPVMVSKKAGCAPDLVDEGRNGFTFHPEDTETLSELMVLLSSSQLDLQAMGQASRDLIKKWGLNRFTNGLMNSINAAFI